MNLKLPFLIILFISSFSQANQETWNLNFDETNIPYVSLDIAGEKINLTLDTGSARGLHIPLEVINKLPNIKELPEKKRSIDVTGKNNVTRTFVAHDLVVNSLTFNDVDIAEYKSWGWTSDDTHSKEFSRMSVVGLNFFKNHVFILDLPHKKIVISDEQNASLDSTKNWHSIPFVLSDEGLIIEMTDNKKTYKLVLDTGASVSFIKAQSLSPKTIKNSNEQFEGYETVKLSSNLKQINSDNINAIILDGFPAEFEQDGLIGCDFLNENLVKIDLKNKKIWVKKAKDIQ